MKQGNRKGILINKRFQLALVARAMGPVFLVFAFLAVVGFWLWPYVFAQRQINTWEELCAWLSFAAQDVPDASLAISFASVMAVALLLIFLLLGLYFGFVVLFFSHRFIGPAVRFENSFRKILKGDLTDRIALRHKDSFQELAANYNEMADTLQDRIKRIYRFNEHLQETILEMKDNPSADKESSLQKIHMLSQGIEEDLHKFRF